MAPSTATLNSPIGVIVLTANNIALLSVKIMPPQTPIIARNPHPVLDRALAELTAYFDGRRTQFSLPLVQSATAEGEMLRAGIASIAFGKTLTYGALATQIGSVPRAVGQACKTNPYPIIIPCHRVVSATGPEYYSGGNGPRTKSWLLDFEYAHLPTAEQTRLL